METNFIQMVASAGHAEPTWSVQLLRTLSIVCIGEITNGFTNIVH